MTAAATMAVRVVCGSHGSWDPGCSRSAPNSNQEHSMTAKKPGLYANIHAKQERIAKGSNEHMNKSGSKEAPSDKDFKKAAKTEKTTPAKASK